jgi:hypothetical protein
MLRFFVNTSLRFKKSLTNLICEAFFYGLEL